MNRFIRICSALLVGVGFALLGFGLLLLSVWIVESRTTTTLLTDWDISYYQIETLRARLTSVSLITGAILSVGGLIVLQIGRKKDE
jgi:hypothetical protein